MCQLLGMNCNTPTDIVFSFEGFRRRAGPVSYTHLAVYKRQFISSTDFIPTIS